MEKGRGKNEYCQRTTAKKQPNASNNKEESYKNSFENGIDSGQVSLSRYQSVVSLSSGTLDILELGPNSQVDVRSLAGQSGLWAGKELPRRLVAGRNKSLPRKQRQGSSEQFRLHPKPLGASTRQRLSFRRPNRCRTTPVSLTSCSKTFHLSGRTSKSPRQRQLPAHTLCIKTSPNRYTNTVLANKTAPTSPKPSRYQLISPRRSQKSKIPKRLNYNPEKTYIIPKSNEECSKGNTNKIPVFNRLSITSGNLHKRHTSLESPPAKKSPHLAITQGPPSVPPSRNFSYNSSKTSKCTVHASTVSKASKFPSRIVGVRSKHPLIQKPQFLKRTETASKSAYQFGKTNRDSQMTAARRRKLSRNRSPARLSLSLPDNLKSLSTQRREKANKQHNVPGDTILNSKTTTKPLHSAKSRRTRTSSYNKGLWQKKATNMLARSKSAARHETESAKESPSSLTLSPKRKLTRTSPKSHLSKYSPSRTNKGRRLRQPRTLSCKNPASYTSGRTQSFLWGATRSKASVAANSGSGVGFNNLGVYKGHSVQRSPQNVRETSFLFKFQSKRWLLKPSTESVVQCGASEGASNTENRDCFAAWELTKHEVLQSCRSEDLLIMNNAVTQSSPHSHSVLPCCNTLRKTQTPQPDNFLDHQKPVISLDHQKPDMPLDNQKAASIRQETRLYVISGLHPLLSLNVQPAHSMSNIDKKSHSEYTTSTDTASVTSKWSLGSSIYSCTTPTKRQHLSVGTKWPVTSWSCVYCLPNPRKRKKQRGYLTRPKTELENKKEDSFKYCQFSRSPAVNAKPNRVTHQRQHCRLLRTSLECPNSKMNKNKQGKRNIPENSGGKQQRFVTKSSYNKGLQPERSPNPTKSQKMKALNCDIRPRGSKLGSLSSYTVEPEVVTIEQVSPVRSNSPDSQKQTLTPTMSPASKPNKDTGSTLSRVVRKQIQKRVSEAKKCGLVTQPARESPLCVWKWRSLAVMFILLLVMCHYLAFLITITSV